ncbi:type II toxin-antitoxin system RelE/ParE family toxin [Tatumella sp. TA1]|uniref:type II toxin-antitoxin system RelE family toxin n=1 Tax=Rosenbergiella collisarenosi TaxID=1544695 RepID=UPI0008F93955|nr:type II toxin-antitoxin system RelE/ParE family toxin [Rosenbergiella collisarenosi]MBT0720310.1 type II toxin-antitoxin system RelE/ParE family toxin [Rosenbergiella collisarenosi]QGX91983.1 type II toxin-antitoxin system RelE/ParE family toxin [Tatumella sp. TA1]
MSPAFKAKLVFKKQALSEWQALSPAIKTKFKKLLEKRLNSYELLTMPKNRLSLQHNCYKIKLRTDGYRLAYTVHDESGGTYIVKVTVVAVDRRDSIYEELAARMER